MYVHLTEGDVPPGDVFGEENTLIHSQEDIFFGNLNDIRHANLSVKIPDSVRLYNQSLYADVFVCQKHDCSYGDEALKFDRSRIIHRRSPMTIFKKQRSKQGKRNLLSQHNNEDIESEPMVIAHWARNLTINLVNDNSNLQIESIRQLPHLSKHVQFSRSDLSQYLPTLYLNDFWQFEDDLLDRPVNESVETADLFIEYSPIAMWKFQMIVQMDMSFQMQKDSFGISASEIETIKRMLFETNPWLLGVTFAVSLLHSLFDFLAFKNDIQFWKDRKNAEGLSLRSIVLNVVLQSIIFLYLLDTETSWMIIISTAVGLMIEVWKLKKVLRFKIDWKQRSLYGILPFKPIVQHKTASTQKRKETDEYDRIAFKYLSIACFPLVVGYSVYSVMYESHKSWYSWILATAVGFVYTFGFITMTPQLFINYKLKSVAHMPWKTFTYKALNTFVDDLFAFVIKMPTMHRLACFRDDIVFFIYLYQKWIYPVDKTRANEFGQVGEDSKDAVTVENEENYHDKKNK